MNLSAAQNLHSLTFQTQCISFNFGNNVDDASKHPPITIFLKYGAPSRPPSNQSQLVIYWWQARMQFQIHTDYNRLRLTQYCVIHTYLLHISVKTRTFLPVMSMIELQSIDHLVSHSKSTDDNRRQPTSTTSVQTHDALKE